MLENKTKCFYKKKPLYFGIFRNNNTQRKTIIHNRIVVKTRVLCSSIITYFAFFYKINAKYVANFLQVDYTPYYFVKISM